MGKPFGKCAVCHTNQDIRKDGRIAGHKRNKTMGLNNTMPLNYSVKCSGGGQPPKPSATEAERGP